MEIFEAEIIEEFNKKMQSYVFLNQKHAAADKITRVDALKCPRMSLLNASDARFKHTM